MTAKVIRLVQGDNLPYISISLKNSDGTALNVKDAVVVVRFRAANTKTTLSILECSPVTDGADGKVKFNFPGTTLNVPQGNYEGEVEVSFGGLRQTVYETLKFVVRAQFA